MTAYADAAYAAALAEFGTPCPLPRSGGWVLERAIPDSPYRDAIGCYPLFACADWAGLREDLEELGDRFVSLTIVTDPFGAYVPGSLCESFPDLARPFKQHFVTDLSQPVDGFASRHHRRYASKARREVAVLVGDPPIRHLEEWLALYQALIVRHRIHGIAAFSRRSFERQFLVPGLRLLRAEWQGNIVGMTLWFVSEKIAYYHLGAYNAQGYAVRAAFALFREAIDVFAGAGVRWLSLGGGAGIQSTASDGLSRFKHGWATGTRTAFLCGRIFNRPAYEELCAARGAREGSYFPAYRQGEFGA